MPDPDLFISHAHADHAIVEALVTWIEGVFPDVVIARTEPDADQAFREDPTYFLSLAERSRCILYIATPNSIERRMVDTEIGINAHTPIITLAAGGVTLGQLRQKNEESLFLSIDLSLAMDARRDDAGVALVRLLRTVLGLSRPNFVPALILPLVPYKQDPDNAMRYVRDYLAMASSSYGVQDAESAKKQIIAALSARIEKEGERSDDVAVLLASNSPEQNLLIFLTMSKDSHWQDIVDLFPVLLNDDLLALLEFAQKNDHTERMAELRNLVEIAALQEQLTTIQEWGIERGERFLGQVGVHPKALEFFDHLVTKSRPGNDFDFGFHEPKGEPPISAIRQRVARGQSAREWFVTKLSERIVEAAGRGTHNRVLYCLTDFNTGELANLTGSDWIERRERTPRMGMRGLVRYVQPCYRSIFEWEMEACARAAGAAAKIALAFPMVRIPKEFQSGIKLALESGVPFSGVGFIPESPSSCINAADFITVAAHTFPDKKTSVVIFTDLDAIASGFQLEPEPDLQKAPALLLKVLMGFLSEIRKAAAKAGITAEIAISAKDLDRLRKTDGRVALAVAKQLTFFIENL